MLRAEGLDRTFQFVQERQHDLLHAALFDVAERVDLQSASIYSMPERVQLGRITLPKRQPCMAEPCEDRLQLIDQRR